MTLAVVKDPVRLIDPVIVDIDGRSLRSGFQHRLAVVPADTPDKVQDAAAFARDTVAAQPARTRAFLSARSAGANEVRLYYIPQFGSEFVIAGRAKLTVQPGAPGAIEASQLLREAAVLGVVGFENAYRGRSMAMQGQFLRVEQHSAEELGAAVKASGRPLDPGKTYAALFVGWNEPVPNIDGSPSELVCVLPVDDATLQARKLAPGEPVLVRGTPASWGVVSKSTAVVVGNCQLVP